MLALDFVLIDAKNREHRAHQRRVDCFGWQQPGPPAPAAPSAPGATSVAQSRRWLGRMLVAARLLVGAPDRGACDCTACVLPRPDACLANREPAPFA